MVQKRGKQNYSVAHHCRAGGRETRRGASSMEVHSEKEDLRLGLTSSQDCQHPDPADEGCMPCRAVPEFVSVKPWRFESQRAVGQLR